MPLFEIAYISGIFYKPEAMKCGKKAE